MKLPLDQTRVQRVGWMMILVSIALMLLAMAMQVANMSDYTWRMNANPAVLVPVVFYDACLQDKGYREWWQIAGYFGFQLIIVGAVAVALGNVVQRLLRRAVLWIGRGS
jgi:hypothetical protein